MGVDERLLAPQRRRFPDLIVPPWISARPGESLPQYARQWAAAQSFPRPFALGGISFGGMVALEAAHVLRPSAVLLLASARSSAAVYPHLRRLERWTRGVPDTWLEPLRRPLAALVARRNRLVPRHTRLLLRYAVEADIPFLRWAVRAIMEWPAADNSRGLPCPVYQIHGDRDPLLRLDRRTTDHVIPGGRHLINLTHSEAVNAWLAERLGNVRAPEDSGAFQPRPARPTAPRRQQ